MEGEAFNILKTKLDEFSATLSPKVSPTNSSSSSSSSPSSLSSSSSPPLDPPSSSSPDPFIFKVPHQLRQVTERVRKVNKTAFEPQMISIGPYHGGKYQTMETCKARYLSNLLARGANQDRILRDFIAHSQNMENSARSSYAGTLNMSSAEFVAMMVLDGLFVVELLRKFREYRLKDQENDDLFKQNFNLTIIAQDLLLLENQLPFSVLNDFFEKIKSSGEHLDVMAIHFFSKMVPELKFPRFQRPNNEGREAIHDIKHLLGLVHDRCLPSPQKSDTSRGAAVNSHDFTFIRSATELSEVGIRFKKREGNSLFDVKFERGQLHIPTLIVDHDTERIYRNLIAYEQLNHGSTIVMDYARLMDCLINYADDVALLSNCGIIDNRLGTREEVANMFNKLNDYVHFSGANFYYSELFHDVNERYNRLLSRWKVKLRQTYFYIPWDWVLTSIAAAIILLILTLVQTIFSVLAYLESKKSGK
ncbi:hypothetical protein PTKIN_Ptkin06aG0184600 [Pterospermum kingtungense]